MPLEKTATQVALQCKAVTSGNFLLVFQPLPCVQFMHSHAYNIHHVYKHILGYIICVKETIIKNHLC